MPSITVIGSINRDIVARVPHMPAPGETVLGSGSAQHPGGKGANQAVAAARLRVDAAVAVRMIGRIGRDGFGAEMVAFLSAEGIDVSGVTVSDTAGTGIALITVDDRGENAIAVISGANIDWPDGIPALSFEARDVLVCQLEIPLDVVTVAVARAKAARATTILNPAPFQALPAVLLANTDVLVLNAIELGQMLRRDHVAMAETKQLVTAARDVLALGPGSVIVTLGASGVLLVEASGRAERIPGRPVQAVDTTGAGDCFVGALAAALVRDDDLLAAAHFANRAAAVSVTRAGAASSIPRREEIT